MAPGNRSEIGRTERAAARRNKIFSAQMRVDIREIERDMKIKMRQIELTRNGLYSELDGLERRSGWLHDVEKTAVVPGYMQSRKPASVSTPKERQNPVKQRKTAGFNKRSVFITELDPSRRPNSIDSEAIDKIHEAVLVGRRNESPPQSRRAQIDLKQQRTERVVSSASDNQHENERRESRKEDRRSSSATSAKVRFRPPSTLTEQFPEVMFEGDDELLSLDISEYSPDSPRRSVTPTKKSLLYIPSSDSRYRLLDVPIMNIDVKKIREHAMKSQRSRVSHLNRLSHPTYVDETPSAGSVDIGGEYIPKRVKIMRKQRLNMRREKQAEASDNLITNTLSKFKDLYIVPNAGGLKETK